MGILNTMNNEIISAQTLLKDTGVKLIDAARLIQNTLDTLPKEANISPLHYCSKIIEIGKHNYRLNDVKLKFLTEFTNIRTPPANIKSKQKIFC